MPPRKRGREEVDINAEKPAAKSSKGAKGKRTRRGNGEQQAETANASNSNDRQEEVPEEQKDPYEYITMVRPKHDREMENRDTNELDGEALEEQYEADEEARERDQPASERPDHKWIIMRKAWLLLCTSSREATFRCPDLFNSYVYNDFEGYGQLELLENYLVSYSNEFKKKDRNLKEMWILLVALGHWLSMADLEPMHMIDDGYRLNDVISLMGCALLSMLNALDRADQLGSNSEYKDLGLVIGLYQPIAYGLDCDHDDEWTREILMYAVEKGIDVSTVYGTNRRLEEVESEIPDWPKEGVDRWGFAKRYNAHKKKYGKMGGTHFDITKWSRAERAQYAFDHKDPLAGIPENYIKAGNIAVS
ncbi:hypothetical protein LTR05_003027 [Lithohypha guttulata]|uniref:Uncharacterized protein n=1 Tax=Lithohypha guttulata TaxID=1690604 RepID=A0AAN7T3V8_9EURO|nr:hypothetical protein LTR05_003027 [Lithohypha guttulata]